MESTRNFVGKGHWNHLAGPAGHTRELPEERAQRGKVCQPVLTDRREPELEGTCCQEDRGDEQDPEQTDQELPHESGEICAYEHD